MKKLFEVFWPRFLAEIDMDREEEIRKSFNFSELILKFHKCLLIEGSWRCGRCSCTMTSSWLASVGFFTALGRV